ncbi:MAG: hypothetical protein V7L22_31180 [Nostoc sp.]|uniref:hypothetical protein n=1 Tax=Nostoc sp. TaxID=1180 RepID=UPI002FFB32A6
MLTKFDFIYFPDVVSSYSQGHYRIIVTKLNSFIKASFELKQVGCDRTLVRECLWLNSFTA